MVSDNKENAVNDKDGKFLKNIGNKLAEEDESSIKSGSLNKELEGLTKINDNKYKYYSYFFLEIKQ